MGLWYWDNGWGKNDLFRAKNPLKAILACPGPSLKQVQNLQGPGRFILGINTSYPTVRPDMWIGMDEAWCYDSNLMQESFPKIFRGTYCEMFCEEGKVKKMPFTYFADVASPPAGKTMLDLLKPDTKFSWHNHTLGVAFHIIMWMGFKEIYLVGCDMGGKKDYCHDLILEDAQRKRNQELYNKQIVFIERLTKAALKFEIKIISSTPNSPLNEFLPYVPLAEIPTVSKTKTQIRYVTDRPCTPVTVLKSGGEYKIEHVYRLAKQVPNLVCFSDIDIPNIPVIKLKHNWPGWWSKIELFRPDAIPGDILHIDLDTIVKNITPFLAAGKTTMLRDFHFPNVRNSTLMYIHTNDKEKIYNKFLTNTDSIMQQYSGVCGKSGMHGDQGFLTEMLPNVQCWQDILPGKAVSYRLHGNVDGAGIVCFYGKPRPWDVNL
jgi:hypothetical protein